MRKICYTFFFIPLIVLIISIGLVVFNSQNPTFHEKNLDSKNFEIVLTNQTNILNDDGSLNLIGWGRSPVNYVFDPKKIKPSTTLNPYLNFLRYKKWEFYMITHPDFALGLAVFDVSYIGGNFIHFNDLTKPSKEIYTEETLIHYNKPKIYENCWSDCESASYSSGSKIKFSSSKEKNKNSQVIEFSYDIPDLKIEFKSRVSCPECDSIVTTTPINEDTTLFYHNVKSYGMSQTGKIKINDKSYNLKDCTIAYDSGRGAWPVASGWLWMTSSGKTKDGKNISINIGHGFSHPKSSKHTEDSFFIDGKIFKLPAVITKEVKHEYPQTTTYWSFESVEHPVLKNRCDFRLDINKSANLDQDFKLFKVDFKINYGNISGKCKDEEGKVYEFENILGFLEIKRSVW
jgi:hypothetical protein